MLKQHGGRDCLVIADDLTGACDAAVHFAIRNRGSVALISAEYRNTNAAVVAVSTDSRDVDRSAILSAISKVASHWAADPARMLFKKIDSMLRGNAGLEIRGMMEAFECEAAVITPGYPALGRIVQNGWLSVAGDPGFEPVNVAPCLAAQGLDPCVHVRLDQAAAAVLAGAQAVVADAITDADLDRLVAEIQPLHRRILWAGSGGLASALARALPAGNPKHLGGISHTGPVLFCIGSDHRVTLAQQQALAAIRPVAWIKTETATPASIQSAIRRGEQVVLRIPRNNASATQIRELIRGTSAAALLLSGGDTASLVSRAIGAETIELIDEIVPGLPRGVLRGGDLDGWAVVTKSGAFGDAESLIQVADFFSCHKN
jgi:D-threonate/D-erythronate kinase